MKRRNSVEWAQWTHQQNMEMLHTLKMEAFEGDDKLLGKDRDQPGISREKMSKLMSRKVRTPQQTPPLLPKNALDDTLYRLSEDPVGSREVAHSNEEMAYLEAEIATLRSERDLLLEDQSKLVGIIQSDNAKLVQVLNEVKLSKQKLASKIESLEKERMKLKAFSSEVIDNNLESILASMPLTNLVASKENSDMHQPAEELHSKLVDLISQIRSQQADVLQRALSKVELAEKYFLADKMAEVDNVLDELTRVASNNPGNVQAADLLMQSMPRSLIEIIAERLGEFQKTRVEPEAKHEKKKITASTGDHRIDNALELIDGVLGGGSSGGVTANDAGWLSGAGTDPKSLITQNNVLKAGMVLLRKKNSEMRARIASLTSRKSRNGISKTDREVSSSPSPDGRATLRASHREKVTGNTTNDESEDLVESDVEDPLIEPESAPAIQVKNKRQARENNRKASEARARRMFNSLPVEQQEYIWNVLVVAVAENVENHPLASSVSSQLKQEAVLEVSLQVREILASVLVLPINEMQVGKNKNESDLVISQDALHAMLIRALSFTPVATEIQVHSNMIMVYLFSRFGDTVDGIESEPSTYSLPAPNFPVSQLPDKNDDHFGGFISPGAKGGVYMNTPGLNQSGGARNENGRDNDKASSTSSRSSDFMEETRDRFNYEGSMEYDDGNLHSLQDGMKRRNPPTRAPKPSYMGGTRANASKRMSTLKVPSDASSPANRVAALRQSQREVQPRSGARNATASKTQNGRDPNEFKYFAYRKTSILDKELPDYRR